MNNSYRNFSLFCTILLLSSLFISAQEHFTFTSNTGNNMTVLIKSSIEPNIHGTVLEDDDEIGVFTSEGLCVGAVVWESKNVTITVWGDDEQTITVDGIGVGDTLFFRIWDASASEELTAAASYESGIPVYAVDGISILKNLSVETVAILSSLLPLRMNAGLSSVKIYTIQGKLVYRSFNLPVYPDLSAVIRGCNLPRGNYILSAESGNTALQRMITVLK